MVACASFVELAEEPNFVGLIGTILIEAEDGGEAAAEGGILDGSVLPGIPEAGVDVGSDEDLRSHERDVGSFDFDVDFITIYQLKIVGERHLRCCTGEVIEQEDVITSIAIEPSGIRSLAVTGGADGVEVVDIPGLATSGRTIEEIDGRDSISFRLVELAEGGDSL